MPNAGNSTYSLVIISLGILGVIISFLVTDKKKYYIAIALSLLVVCMGLFGFIGSSVQGWRMSRRISKLQETQRLNLEALQSRLRDASERAKANAPGSVKGAPVPTPVTSATVPAAVKKKK